MPNRAQTDTAVMTDKEFVFDLLRRLPDDVSIYQIAQKLEFIAAVRQGLDELDSGRSVSIEQIERDLTSWSVTINSKGRRRQKRDPQKQQPEAVRRIKTKTGDSLKSPASSPERNA